MTGAMTDVTHDLLNRLRVVSKIKEGQKLDISNGVNVYSDGWYSWFMRKWNRDNKDEGIRFLRDLYKAVQQSAETIINESKYSTSEAKKHMANYVINNIAVELRASIRGLENMHKTYAHYPTTTAAIDGILKDYVIVTYSSLLEAIPKDKIAKELKESITFMGIVVYRGEEGIHSPAVGPSLPTQTLPQELEF